MRWSRTLIPTLREDPTDAESVSHKLMIRAGLVRQLSAGVYSYLPLGTRALQKAAAIVREEMNRAGAVELSLPVLHPAELWQETGRLDGFGEVMFRLKDRKGKLNVLGPTHEEVITHIVRNEVRSYRQVPITLYQIQTKFRDEPRPRFGVVRTREFIMKDAYSFDLEPKGLEKSYRAMFDAYCRIFDRCGLKYVPIEADTGLMGGDVSHEFMVPSPAGEDVMVCCSKCGYAANREKTECVLDPQKAVAGASTTILQPREEVPTPGATTVEQVCALLRVKPKHLLKTIIFKTNTGPLAALVRGDHDVNLSKLARAAQAASLEMADPETILRTTGGPLGFSGPVGLNIRIIADSAVSSMENFVTGANRPDAHYINVNVHRDFRPDLVTDIRNVVDADPCPKCGASLTFTSGIEIGHVFKLGTKYTQAMKAHVLDERGESKPMVMGSYGIGVNRILASAIENSYDLDGIIWPKEIAPYAVEVLALNTKDLRVVQAADQVYEDLIRAGLDTLLDDRDVTAGVKFADADLIGLPIRVVVGKGTVEKETVDLRHRNRKELRPVPVHGVVAAVQEELAHYAT